MISWRLRPARLMRSHGLTYTQADRIIRHHSLLHARRFGWVGGIALSLLVLYIGSGMAGPGLGAARPLLLAGGSLGTGLHLWLAQRAAYTAILREADELRGHRKDKGPVNLHDR